MVIDMSTVGRDAVLAVADRLPGGVEMLDSPVTGSTPRAEAAPLPRLAGADSGRTGLGKATRRI